MNKKQTYKVSKTLQVELRIKSSGGTIYFVATEFIPLRIEIVET